MSPSLEDDEDIDFDDPRFLVEPTTNTSSNELTYADRRRKTVGRGREKALINQRKGGRGERERQVREEGLRRDLLKEGNGERGGGNVGLRMMKNMGFEPGHALGKKRTVAQAELETESSRAATSVEGDRPKGLGFRAGLVSDTMESIGTAGLGTKSGDQPRLEPIGFEIRQKRTGLGIPQSKVRPTFSFLNPKNGISANPDSIDPRPLENVDSYLANVKATLDSRKAFGYLRSLRRTLETLDRGAGIVDSVMWRDPEEELEPEVGEDLGMARKRLLGRDKVWNLGDREEEEERGEVDQAKRKSSLGYARGLNNVVVELEEDDDGEGKEPDLAALEEARERAEWMALDTRTRLAYTLSYLRREYQYCFWCGCRYEGKEDLEANCPGENEEDH
ncbi:BQ2448_4517 [Microbotryum intermedium]|uniref:BQ2448_4517 protein n=1 Tax=Microbotryum intermedium TaxID=269621 RepID=A0A238FIJ3_9BASI|nr:BQ2448_4517 [Microbotryum intermedium]